MENEIPEVFFRDAWENAEHPMACVGTDNKFVDINSAFERLLGYSEAEMRGKTWIEYTVQEDVGGDLASVNAVLEGRASHYRLDKRYKHKRGHAVPVTLIVRRFPVDMLKPILFFSVEAPLQHATQIEFESFKTSHQHTFEQLIHRIDELESKGMVTVTNQQGDRWHDGDKTGRDKTSNSDKTIKYLCAAVIALAAGVSWFAYYVATTSGNGTVPQPPPAVVK